MSRIMRYFLSFIALVLSLGAFAQVPQGISYQAVARNTDGSELIEQSLDIRISIREDDPSGPISWQEEHSVQTNAFGLFTLVIGDGASTGAGSSASFAEVAWAEHDHFLQVELDPGDGIYELMGISQLLSVPYAFAAGRALNTDDADADPTNELVTGLVLNGNQLEILQAGGSVTVDLTDALADGDEIIGNESLTLFQLQGTILNVVESGQALSVDLASIADDQDWVKEDGKVYNTTEKVGVGTANPTSDLDVKGSQAIQLEVFSGAVLNLDDSHHAVVVNVTDQSTTVNLPAASTCPGRVYVLKKITSQNEGTPITNTLTIQPQAGETIDFNTNQVLNSFFRQEITIGSDGSNWWILSRSTNE